MAKAPQRPELDWFRGGSIRKKPASTREIDAIARSDRFEKDSSAYSRSEMDSFYGSQLTGKSGPKFDPDPVNKSKLNLSFDPSPKKFGKAVEDYQRRNPNRGSDVEDRRGETREEFYKNEMKPIDWSQHMPDNEDAGPAGLKSGQSRKASPEEAIAKMQNRK